MIPPLLTSDARALSQLARPRWHRRISGWIMVAGVAVVSGLHTANQTMPCTDRAPCEPDPVGSVAVGVLFTVAVAGFVLPRLAAWLAAVFAVASSLSAVLIRPSVISPAWLYAVDLAFVAVCFLVSGAARWRRSDMAYDWLAATPRQRLPGSAGVPVPAGPRRLGRIWLGLGATLLVIAAVPAAWSWFTHARVAEQQQRATQVTAEVVAQRDEFTIQVRMPTGEVATIYVFDASNHPVGQRMDLYVDGLGLRQPVSEPYDATGWLFLGVLLGGVGVVCLALGTEQASALRGLLTEAQPVTRAYVLRGWRTIVVYAGDVRPGEPAVAQIPVRIRATGPAEPAGEGEPTGADLAEGEPTGADLDEDAEDELTEDDLTGATGIPPLPIEPAVLYGLPAPGRWCAVVVNGATDLPAGPLRHAVTAPPFAQPPGRPVHPVSIASDGPSGERAGPVAADPSDLDLRPEEIEALWPPDRDPDPHQIRHHVRHPLWGCAMAMALPYALVALPLPALSYGSALPIAAAAVALSSATAWRLSLRPRLAWNGGGVAVLGLVGARRMPWPEVTRIDHGHGTVTIHTDSGSYPVGAGRGIGMLGLRERSREQLVNALRQARHRAVGTVDPPQLPTARRRGLLLLWLVYSPLLAWAVVALGGA